MTAVKLTRNFLKKPALADRDEKGDSGGPTPRNRPGCSGRSTTDQPWSSFSCRARSPGLSWANSPALSKVTSGPAAGPPGGSRPGHHGRGTGGGRGSERRALRRQPRVGIRRRPGGLPRQRHREGRRHHRPADRRGDRRPVRGRVIRSSSSTTRSSAPARAPGSALDQLMGLVIGTRGVVDPAAGTCATPSTCPAWHFGVLAELRADLGRAVRIENDVNLAALAEQAHGAARGLDDFVIMWAGIGAGPRRHARRPSPPQGITGGAGEIGWLPVPGEPLPSDVRDPQSGSFQRLVGGDARPRHGAGPRGASAGGARRRAGRQGRRRGERELPRRARRPRLAVGVAAVAVVLDPGLIVLSGDVGRAGERSSPPGSRTRWRGSAPSRPRVAVTEVEGNPVLQGALVAALEEAREQVFSDTV